MCECVYVCLGFVGVGVVCVLFVCGFLWSVGVLCVLWLSCGCRVCASVCGVSVCVYEGLCGCVWLCI